MVIKEHILKIRGLWKWIVDHKYRCVTILFACIILFFDENNLVFKQWPIRCSNNQLMKEKLYYENKIREDSTMLYELKTNDDNLKKFAREHYYMKANDEDVFVIEER